MELAHIGEYFGLKDLEVVTNRRGAMVIKGNRVTAPVALKLQSGDASVVGTSTLAHEALITQQVQPYSRLSYIDHGHHSDFGPWLMTEWVDGEKLTSADIPMLVEAYIKLHAGGFLHGDVQPRHLHKVNEQVVLLDWGLGCGPDIVSPPYMGALVHYVAPEVAEMMLRGEPYDYDIRAEIYSIGATLYYLLTGHPPVDYGTEDIKSVSFRDKLACIVEGRLKSPQRSDELMAVALAALETSPGKRVLSLL